MKARLVGRACGDVVGRDGFMISAGRLVPNMSLVHNCPGWGLRDVLTIISLRNASRSRRTRPRFVVVRGRRRGARGVQGAVVQGVPDVLGSTGMFEQAKWRTGSRCTSTAAGEMARRLLVNSGLWGCWPTAPPWRPRCPEQFGRAGEANVGLLRVQQAHMISVGGLTGTPGGAGRRGSVATANGAQYQAPGPPGGAAPVIGTSGKKATVLVSPGWAGTRLGDGARRPDHPVRYHRHLEAHPVDGGTRA